MLQAIDGLEADVLTIENSRSGNEMINALAKYGYSRVSSIHHVETEKLEERELL